MSTSFGSLVADWMANLKTRLGRHKLPAARDRSGMTRSSHPPVFVRGMSRSGGTLMVTLLDAHPEIAMSYELYPDLLRGQLQTDARNTSPEYDVGAAAHAPLDLNRLIGIFDKHGTRTLQRLKDDKDLSDVRTFIGRAMRSGVELQDFCEILRDHLGKGLDVRSRDDRLRLVESVALEKMHREEKSRWGCKCSGDFAAYLSVWPEARLINIIRDGRDVLASQLNTGNFKNSPAEVGRLWKKTHLQFRELVENPDVHALEVSYEKLVTQPDVELPRICAFIGVPYDPKIIDFHSQDLSIFNSPRGHLSIDRISKPIDETKIGRWRADLDQVDLAAFMEEAGDTLERFGYSKD